MVRTPVPQSTKVPEVRKGDTIVVLKGKDAGKRGVVERVVRNPGGWAKTHARLGGASNVSPMASVAVVVEGLNIAKRHTKPRQRAGQSDRMPRIQQGGILDIAQPIAIGNVMVVCPRCDQPTRIGHRTLENGESVRVCRHCGEQLEVKTA